MGDVLEHIELESAKELLSNFIKKNKCSHIIVSIPFEYEQDSIYGNKYEKHLQPDVNEEYMKEHYPYLKLIDSSAIPERNSSIATYVWDEKYKISIVVPVYNVENYIRDSLESIVNQTIGFENLEVIMVDDCSTDRSGEIIDEYSSKYDNFISIHLPKNSGVAGKPRNIGMKEANAKYIMFLDPDDYYDNTMCETLYNKIQMEDVDIVSGNYIYETETEKRITNFENKGFGKIETVKVRSVYDNINLFRLPPMVWTKIFNRNLIEENNIQFPEGILGEDFVFVLHTFLVANGIVFLNKLHSYHYRVRENENPSISFQYNKNRFLSVINAYNQVLKLFKKYEKEEYFPITCVDHLGYILAKLLYSNLTITESREVLEKSEIIFEHYKNLELVPINFNKKIITLFNLIVQKRIDEALLLIENSRKVTKAKETSQKDVTSVNI
jgi:poly(ribitol-phosphate) beta-N-acetylglucosaminyltransferase